MDTKKIKALLTAVESGSLSAASEALGYTQSGLTHMMNSLEDEMGISLLVRSKSGVRLSAAGQMLSEDLRTLVAASDNLEKNVEAVKARGIQTIRIGSYSSIARQWLPSILAEYKFASPDVDMSVSMQNIREQYNAVKDDELDLAIVSYQKDMMSGLSWTPLRDDELVAILPGTYSADEGAFPVEYFSGMEFLMPSGGFELDIMPIFSSLSPRQMPAFRYTNMDDSTIVSMVSHGLGVSVMSRLIMQGLNESAAVVSLEPHAFRRLGIIVKEKRKNEKAIKGFISTARSTLERL